MGELYHNMDFEFYDCKVKTFEVNVQTHELWLHCLYRKCEPVTIRYQGVEAVDGLGILPNKTIEYMTYHYDERKDCNRYEIKFQEVAERTIIWADRMGRTENESIVSLS